MRAHEGARSEGSGTSCARQSKAWRSRWPARRGAMRMPGLHQWGRMASLLLPLLVLSVDVPVASGRQHRHLQEAVVGRVAQLEAELRRWTSTNSISTAGSAEPSELAGPQEPLARHRDSLGGGDTSAVPSPLEALEVKLERAEELYLSNMARRDKAIRDWGGELRTMPQDDIRAIYFNPTYSCPLEGRIGQWGDGGKWVCLTHRRSDTWKSGNGVAVSIGCRGDTSFESDLFDRLGMRPHSFDFSLPPNLQRMMDQVKFLKFYNMGVTGESSRAQYATKFPDAKFVSVKEVLEFTGSNYVDILKIDCEMCEYNFTKDLREQFTRETIPFGQIQMEFHYALHWWGQHVPDSGSDMLAALEELGYRLFHAEVNAFHPDHYEIAMIHERLVIPQSAPPPAVPLANSGAALAADLALAREQYGVNSGRNWCGKPGKEQTARSLPYFIVDCLVPEYPCGLEARLGPWGMGGKWVCLQHSSMGSPPLILSIKSSLDSSFEVSSSNLLHATSHVFVPPDSLDPSPPPHQLLSFVKIHHLKHSAPGASEPLHEGPLDGFDLGVPEMLQAMDATSADMLHLDCDGCEHAVVSQLASVYNKDTTPFGQILIHVNGKAELPAMLELLRKVDALGYAMFHAEVLEYVLPGRKGVGYTSQLGFLHSRLMGS